MLFHFLLELISGAVLLAIAAALAIFLLGFPFRILLNWVATSKPPA